MMEIIRSISSKAVGKCGQYYSHINHNVINLSNKWNNEINKFIIFAPIVLTDNIIKLLNSFIIILLFFWLYIIVMISLIKVYIMIYHLYIVIYFFSLYQDI